MDDFREGRGGLVPVSLDTEVCVSLRGSGGGLFLAGRTGIGGVAAFVPFDRPDCVLPCGGGGTGFAGRGDGVPLATKALFLLSAAIRSAKVVY